MTQKITNAILALGLVALGAFVALTGHPAVPGTPVKTGAISNAVTWYDHNATWQDNTQYYGSQQQLSISSLGALTLGTGGNAVANLAWSNCALIAPSYTVAASTTVPMDCALSGAVSGDFVLASFGSTTIPIAGGWRIVGASASTTSGYDTLQVRNETGASAVIPSVIASSTRVLNLR